MGAFRVRMPSGDRYWTVVDDRIRRADQCTSVRAPPYDCRPTGADMTDTAKLKLIKTEVGTID